MISDLFKTSIKDLLSSVTKIGLELNLLPLKSEIHKIYALNIHHIPDEKLNQFKETLINMGKHFHFLNCDDLDLFFNGQWSYQKPGLLLHFDDGFSSQYQAAIKVLEELNIKAWFNIIPAFINCPKEDLENFIKTMVVQRYSLPNYKINNLSPMTWNQIIELSKKGHSIGCHTLNHTRMVAELSQEKIRQEIIEAKQVIEDKISQKIDGFCWPGGEQDCYNDYSKELVKKHFKYAFPSFYGPILKSNSPYGINRSPFPIENNHVFLGFNPILEKKDLSKKDSFLKGF